jgi:hypothetical protein
LFAGSWGLLTGALQPALRSTKPNTMQTFAQTAIFVALTCAFLYDAFWANSYRPEMERYSVAVRALWNDVDTAQNDGLDSILVKNFPTNPFGLSDPEPAGEITFVNSCMNQLARLQVEFTE